MGVRRWCDSFHHLQLCLGMIYYVFWQGLGKVMQKSFCTPTADVVKSLNGFKSNASGCVCGIWHKSKGSFNGRGTMTKYSLMSFECKWSSRNYTDTAHVSRYAYHYTRDTMQFSRAWIRNIPTDAHIAILLWRVKVDTAIAWQGYKRGHDVAVWHYNGNSTLSSSLWPW